MRGDPMKQYEAVIKVMEQNGGYATLAHLYQHSLEVPGCHWKTKTPFASMRRIVQDQRFFFKIKPGLWALKSHTDKLPPEMLPAKKQTRQQEEFTHSYYQGLLVQLGNLRDFETFIPAQDKNKTFLGASRLGTLAMGSKMYNFSYDHVVAKARTIDVVWVNSRKMPASLFEVEHSTDMKNSLVKFVEMQDFRTQMVIVAHTCRRTHFHRTLLLNAFKPIQSLVGFWSYEQLSQLHAKTFELKTIEDSLN